MRQSDRIKHKSVEGNGMMDALSDSKDSNSIQVKFTSDLFVNIANQKDQSKKRI